VAVSRSPRLLAALSALVLLSSLSAPRILRAQSEFVLDPAASHVTFRGRALAVEIVGRSTDLTGAIELVPTNPRIVQGQVRFAVASLETEPPANKAEVEKVFGGAEHPEVTFVVDSTTFDNAANTWLLHGQLVMRGVSRPVDFLGTARRVGQRILAHGEARVDIRDWGIAPPEWLLGLVRMDALVTLGFHAEFRPVEPTRSEMVELSHTPRKKE
jgi:polyisoprenoid-binding protein YceI